MIIVMVGLPARGKSYISRRLSQYLSFFYGVPCKVFNVGNYRRETAGAFQTSDFFDPSNETALNARIQASQAALSDLSAWMSSVLPARLEEDKYVSGDFGALALFDATNTSVERRQWILEQVAPLGAKVIFLESICNDQELIERNIVTSKVGVKDYAHVGAEAAVQDFRDRIKQYEKVYVSLSEVDETHLSFIKMVDGGRQFTMNNIRGFLPSRMAQFLMNMHVEPRSFYFTRHGQSEYNSKGKVGGDSGLSASGNAYAKALAEWVKVHLMLDEQGKPRPTRLWTSSMKRCVETARFIPQFKFESADGTEWINMRPKVFRNLDELYAGECDGMTYDEIAASFPEDAERREKDKFSYRYPRGESYADLIARLEPIAHEMERQREPLLIVAHQGILRVLYSYFMEMPREQCVHVPIPLNTVIKLTPTAKGCYEERFTILEPAAEPDSH